MLSRQHAVTSTRCHVNTQSRHLSTNTSNQRAWHGPQHLGTHIAFLSAGNKQVWQAALGHTKLHFFLSHFLIMYQPFTTQTNFAFFTHPWSFAVVLYRWTGLWTCYTVTNEKPGVAWRTVAECWPVTEQMDLDLPPFWYDKQHSSFLAMTSLRFHISFLTQISANCTVRIQINSSSILHGFRINIQLNI